LEDAFSYPKPVACSFLRREKRKKNRLSLVNIRLSLPQGIISNSSTYLNNKGLTLVSGSQFLMKEPHFPLKNLKNMCITSFYPKFEKFICILHRNRFSCCF